jgi:NAD(P)-dependent dehydrogenase (short-subunit alcohol dehydrogenase family)
VITVSDTQKVAIISGCSSGIGLATAVEMAKEGYFVYATMRDLAKKSDLEKIVNDESLPVKILQMNVGKQETIDSTVATIMQEKGRIDVLVNNAGYMRMGSLEDTDMAHFEDQMQVDFFGPVRLLKKIIPIMREQKSGHIFNIGSIAGKVGFALSSAYSSSKYALEGLTEVLRGELSPYGINATIIEPGVVKTKFIENMKKYKLPDEVIEKSAYKDMTKTILKISEDIFDVAKFDGTGVAKVILDVLKNKPETLRVACGGAGETLVNKRYEFGADDKGFFKWFDTEFMGLLSKG